MGVLFIWLILTDLCCTYFFGSETNGIRSKQNSDANKIGLELQLGAPTKSKKEK